MMTNVWLSCKQLKGQFPLNAKVRVAYPGHAYDGVAGIVSGYHFYGQNRAYLLEIEVVIFKMTGRVTVEIPWNRLNRI